MSSIGPRQDHGKSARALGAALRERGQRPAVEGVVADALPELAQVTSTKTACRLLGTSRATLYRRRNRPHPDTVRRRRGRPRRTRSARPSRLRCWRCCAPKSSATCPRPITSRPRRAAEFGSSTSASAPSCPPSDPQQLCATQSLPNQRPISGALRTALAARPGCLSPPARGGREDVIRRWAFSAPGSRPMVAHGGSTSRQVRHRPRVPQQAAGDPCRGRGWTMVRFDSTGDGFGGASRRLRRFGTRRVPRPLMPRQGKLRCAPPQ